jgi:hypothetical protein
MTLPEGFSPVEHFKSVAIRSYNKLVKEAFKDIDESVPESITSPRASLRTACLIDSKDSSILINNRMMLFYFTLRQAQDLQAPLYGIPTGTYHQNVKFRPQVCLYFREPLDEVDPDFQPLRAQIQFRLMDETETSLSKTKLTTLANKVKSEFVIGNSGYKWRKGKTLCKYTDQDKGYSLQIYAFSVNEGKQIISKVLDLQNDSPDWEKLTINESDLPSGAYPTLPPQRNILGKATRLPRKRPVGNVSFQRATCSVWGLTKPVNLVDLTGRMFDALAD